MKPTPIRKLENSKGTVYWRYPTSLAVAHPDIWFHIMKVGQRWVVHVRPITSDQEFEMKFNDSTDGKRKMTAVLAYHLAMGLTAHQLGFSTKDKFIEMANNTDTVH